MANAQAQTISTEPINQDSLLNLTPTKHSFQDPTPPRFNFISKDKNFTMGIGGFFRFIALYDFDGLINNVDFVTYNIPVSNSDKQYKRFGLGGASSRLFTKLIRKTKKGTIITYIEGDFRGDGNNFHLRKAYFSYRGLTIGQDWTTFMDLDAGPPTVDFEGPNSMISCRQPQIRYERDLSSHWTTGISLEYSAVSGTYDSLIFAIPQRFPDIPARINYHSSWGHLQVAGILRDLTYGTTTSQYSQKSVGWGVNLTSTLKITKQTNFFFQATYGDGIAAYVQDLSESGLDIVPDQGHAAKAITSTVYGGYAAIQQYLNHDQTLFATVVYGFTENEEDGIVAQTTYKKGFYFAGNVFYSIRENLLFGVEYLWGERENLNGDSGEANRINCALQYNF